LDSIKKEQQFTSTHNKLLNHADRLGHIQKDNVWYPISLQVAPTELCNMNCEFCSVKNRGNRSMKFGTLINYIDTFRILGIKSIEITGGGDPTMYEDINDLIYMCDSLFHLKIGLITNGIALDNITQDNLNRLEWLRISLNGLDYDMKPQVPKIMGTLGFSYVWNKKSFPHTLHQICKLANKHNVEYVRIVPDCLNIKNQTELKKEVEDIINTNTGMEKFFVQTKDYNVCSPCYMGGLKPFLYTDEYVYQCSAVALYERKFSEKWRICHAKDAGKVWPRNYKFPDNSMCEKGKCFYSEHNKLLGEIQKKVLHSDFI